LKERFILAQKIYDLILHQQAVLNHFPKSEKFTLTAQIKNCLYDLYKTVIRANKSRNKLQIYYEADVILDQYRMLIRIAHDMRFINNKKYMYISEKVNEIGRIIGAMIKNG